VITGGFLLVVDFVRLCLDIEACRVRALLQCWIWCSSSPTLPRWTTDATADSAHMTFLDAYAVESVQICGLSAGFTSDSKLGRKDLPHAMQQSAGNPCDAFSSFSNFFHPY
jgi:hypothetical protein